MSKRHINDFLKSSFTGSGRIAGTGISYDRYDEESSAELKDENKGNVYVVFPSRSEAEKATLDGPVITRNIKDLDGGN